MAIIETKPAAYKGVEFLMLTSSIAGGRKDVLFEFPNSDKQKIEDLGLRPRSYSVTAIIPHNNYLETRDNLLRVLEDGESGPFDHPFYGRIENIVARNYSINEGIAALGRARIQITFAVSDIQGTPQKSQNAVSEAATLNTVLSESIAEDIQEGFEVSDGFTGNFSDAKILIDSVVNTVGEVTSFATVITTEINQFTANVNTFSAQVNQLIAVPTDLANSVRNAFSSINTVFSSVENTFKALTDGSLFDFGGSDVKVRLTTAGRIQRAKNRDVINQAIQSYALGYAYLNAAQITYATTGEIDTASRILNDQFLKIQRGEGVALTGTASPSSAVVGISSTTLKAIDSLRIITNALLDEKRVDTKKVITITTKRMPMSVLAYRYYGDTALTDALLQMNGIKGASFVEGDIKILSV